MLGRRKNELPTRSPICEKALTWEEIRKLRPGAKLFRYHWHLHAAYPVVLMGVSTHPTHRVALRYEGSGGKAYFSTSDLGAEPYVDEDGTRRWNESNVIVRLRDFHALPKSMKPSS